MNPQLGQGFLHPQALGGTSNPHRRQVRGPDRFFLVAGAERPGEEGVGSPFLSDGGVWSMATVDDGLVR